MSKVVVDIETIGIEFENLDDKSKDYLLKYAKDDEERDKIKESLALSPLTGEIVAIGMFNPDTQKGIMYYQGGLNDRDFSENDILFKVKSESEMLASFWADIKKYKQVVTFNGRTFDGPFLHLRSAILKIKSSRNLVPYRYDYKLHCDLLDQMTYYGASRRFNLDFYTKRFGIRSPKEEGIDGSMVSQMFKDGRQKEIAQYCARDIKATAKLYEYWENYLRF
ncbi:MAG: 3'-5' exonuclease, PolB [Candidatus Moranbacteria bacterium GW2011_GWF2_35_54]|nr:MAG: 3'-5' exonuclease, PolB [Candidatus Moranbacteria bacterium GW2011_GWF2_35_54]